MNTYTASTKIDETKKNEGSRPVKHESKLLYSNYDVEIGKSNIIKPLTTSIDRKYILTSNNGDNESQKEYDFKYVHDFSGTIQNNQFVECAGGGNAINEGEFKLGTADADQTLTMVESFEISSLVKKEVYRDAEGNYYISIICVNIGISSATDEKQNTYNYLSIEDPNEITTPKYKNLTNGEILNELNINPIRVWVSSGEKLSTLYFEDNIDWLNKM